MIGLNRSNDAKVCNPFNILRKEMLSMLDSPTSVSLFTLRDYSFKNVKKNVMWSSPKNFKDRINIVVYSLFLGFG